MADVLSGSDGAFPEVEWPLGATERGLRSCWRTASLAAGWRFPSDWALPEVDVICSAAVRGEVPDLELAALGRARAEAGAGLVETLTDLAALHAVLTHGDQGLIAPEVDATPARLLRVIAVAWAEVALDQIAHCELTDPLTSLPTAAYLRTRLGEVYREASRDRRTAAESHTLVVINMDFSLVAGWSRLTAMILIADAARRVFDGGESVVALGPSTIAVLVPRDGGIASRGVLLRRELRERLHVDAQLRDSGDPRIRILRLPPTHEAAVALLTSLSHS